MKKIIVSIVAIVYATAAMYSQNTFPATGNVGIGVLPTNAKLRILSGNTPNSLISGSKFDVKTSGSPVSYCDFTDLSHSLQIGSNIYGTKFNLNSDWTKLLTLSGSYTTPAFDLMLGINGLNLVSQVNASNNFSLRNIIKTGSILNYKRGLYFTSDMTLEKCITEYINWYNTERLHSSLGYLTPLEMELKLRKIKSIAA